VRELFLFAALALFTVKPLFANELSALEQHIIEYAAMHPDTAYEYFIKQIESGATPEEQAIYLYGMGLVNETKRQGQQGYQRLYGLRDSWK